MDSLPRHNTKGLAITVLGTIPCTVEYVDYGTGFLFVRAAVTDTLHRVHRTDFTPMPSIPPRHRKHVFDSVAHIWKAALEAYPSVVSADPGGLSLDTLVKKLRDSRDAKNNYKWEHPLVDEKLWLERSERIKIGQNLVGKVVILGAAESLRDYRNGSTPAILGAPEVAFSWQSFNQVEQLCWIATQMTPRQIFVVRGLTDEQRASLEQRYDVGIIKLDEQTTQIV
jgi:hypothetical protein